MEPGGNCRKTIQSLRAVLGRQGDLYMEKRKKMEKNLGHLRLTVIAPAYLSVSKDPPMY